MHKQDRTLIYIICILTNLQEKGTERIFYGLDDIKNASEVIIVTHLLLMSLHFLSSQLALFMFLPFNLFHLSSSIKQVEGEIDKLSMEEAGYCNCVSVPDGAPPNVSENIPVQEKV